MYTIFTSLTFLPFLFIVVILFLPPTSLFTLLFIHVILNKVGKKERGSRRTEIAWYRTGALVEKIPIIEEEEIN